MSVKKHKTPRWQRLLLAFFLLLAMVFFFRGWLYRQIVTYQTIGQRAGYSVNDQKLINYIDHSLGGKKDPDVQSIIQLSLSITAQQLNFTAGRNDLDPNKLVYSKTAHCVGYAAFYASTCNYLLQKFSLQDAWMAKHQIGQLNLFGNNIHHYFNTPFFKDHDFVTIENKITGEKFAVDPSLYDYFWIKFVTY